jgi:hypothetical protein
MLKVDDDTLETINKLKSFFEKFKSKWSKVSHQENKQSQMKINFEQILNFIKENYKTIFKGIVFLFVLYWVIYVLTPSLKISEDSQKNLMKLILRLKKLNKNKSVYKIKLKSMNLKLKKSTITSK